MTKTYLLVLLLLTCSIGFAQHLDTKKLDAYFDTLAKHNKFMGSIAISKHGQALYQKTIGYADVEMAKKASATTTYRIGSISKTFTAVLVMQAIAAQKLSLEQSVEQFFPILKNAKQITISQLLAHRSGIADFTEAIDYDQWHTQAQSEKQLTDIIVRGGSNFTPGTQSAYSNSNYVLLTYILERIYQMPFRQLVKEKITDPLALKHTYLGSTINSAKNEAKSYRYANGWKLGDETDLSIPLGAGAMVSTPTDLLRFSEALFKGQLISEKSLQAMLPEAGPMGRGLFSIPFAEHQSFGHRGGIDQFTAVFSYFPKEGIAFALTSNGANYNQNEIPLTALNAVFGHDFVLPNFNRYTIDPSLLARYEGLYANEKLPFKITIKQDGTNLSAQADGQERMILSPTAKDQFAFDETGIVLTFDPSQNTMQLKQGGASFVLKRP